jgi:ABC-type transport system substrate-binding protein
MAKRLITFFVVISLLAFASFVGTPQSGKYGGTAHFGISTTLPSLNPLKGVAPSTRGGTRTILTVYRGLLGFNSDSELVPELAESYKTSDNKTWVFRLRKNAKFHNGEPVTAEDVKFTFDWIRDPDNGAFGYQYLQRIKNTTIIDKHTIEIELKSLDATFASLLTQAGTVIVSKDWWQDPETNPDVEMMGAGPFKFEDLVEGVKIVTTRFDDFYKEGLPYLDKMVVHFYPDEESRVNALLAGDLDIIGYPPWRYMKKIDADPNYELELAPGVLMTVAFNLTVEPWTNIKVREAISYALKRDDYVEGVFYGYAEPIRGPLTPPDMKQWYHEGLAEFFEYNPEKAKMLLTEAGYPDGFKTTIFSNYTYGMYKRTAEILQRQLKEVGIEAELELVDWPEQVERSWSGDFTGLKVIGTLFFYPDPDSYVTTIGISAKPTFASYGIESGDIKLPLMEQALDKARTAVTIEERDKWYRAFEGLFLAKFLQIPLVGRYDGTALSKRVQNYDPPRGQLTGFSAFAHDYIWLE